jgi:sialidase-1
MASVHSQVDSPPSFSRRKARPVARTDQFSSERSLARLRFLTIMRAHPFVATGLLVSAIFSPAFADSLDLFAGTGKSPRHTYRIPTLAVTKQGTLLAFAELRKNSSGDSGDIDTVVKRSTDGGKTWSGEKVMLDLDEHTIGNACPIVDPETGRISVLAVWNRVHESKTAPGFGDESRRVYLTRSDDDGLTWSPPADISRSVKQATWSWVATGPGAGIALTRGKHPGRFVLGINHRETAGEAPGYYALVIYSDDRGATWKSSKTYAARHTNECEVVELTNGDLMLNMRNHGSPKRERAIAISKDGGETWGETTWDPSLPEPQCMASFARHTWPQDDKPGLLLFSNPASQKARENLTLRGSTDDGKTWPHAKLILPGDAAYSHLTILPDGSIALAYETSGYKRIVFTTLKPGEWDAP